MASSIQQFLNKILSNRYGKDVRQAIHDGIEQCYNDVNNPDLNTKAFETAVQNKIDDGSLALMTIPDGSITKKKLDQDTNDTIEKHTEDITDLKGEVNNLDNKSVYEISGMSAEADTHENVDIAILSLYFTNDDRVFSEKYDPETGEVVSAGSNWARYPICPVVPGSKLYAGNYVSVALFGNDGKTFKGNIYKNAVGDTPAPVDIPKDVFYIGVCSGSGSLLTINQSHR